MQDLVFDLKSNPSKGLREALYYWGGFLIWPFGVMILSLQKWSRPWSKNLFWVFCVFLGYCFIITSDVLDSADSARYAQLLTEYAYSDLNARRLFQSFMSESSNNVDILHPLITYIVSQVTTRPTVLMAVFALIFGFFYSRNLWLVLRHANGNITLGVLLFLITFALINPIWNINGFRMWTAGQMFLYGMLSFLLQGDSKKLIWTILAPLMHFSYFVLLLLLPVHFVFKNRLSLYFYFFILTSFIKELDLQAISSGLAFLPHVFQVRISSYTNPDYIESVANAASEYNWYILFSRKALSWVTYAMAIGIYSFYRKSIEKNKVLLSLFAYSLFLYGCANIFQLVPSGGRFLSVALCFCFAFFSIFLAVTPSSRVLSGITLASFPLLLLFGLVSIRTGMDYYGLSVVIGNPVISILFTDDTPLIEVIKGLL